ncbi:MAG: uncharacterized protein A8A55_1788 [Amphiamblys sp. WSBS2006]|nr:MAG: uncharacterized protein A8A55_1788 [Amphiamblys sp. WSBS2006]
MQTFSVLAATFSACVCALGGNFTYVPKDILPRFQTEQERSIYILNERKQADKLRSVYFRYTARDKRVSSPVSFLRFVYDETEAKTCFQESKDIAEEVTRFIAGHVTVDTERKLLFVPFTGDVSPVQAVPEGIAGISILNVEENSIDYCYKIEKEHGNIFDRFLVVEECKREEKGKTPRIKSIPAKRKEAVLLLYFLAEKNSSLI